MNRVSDCRLPLSAAFLSLSIVFSVVSVISVCTFCPVHFSVLFTFVSSPLSSNVRFSTQFSIKE